MPLEKVQILVESAKEARGVLMVDAAGTLVASIAAAFSKNPGDVLKKFAKGVNGT